MSTTKIESVTAIQHLDTIIGDIEELIRTKQDFVGFIILSLGIEFLGSFYDSKPFDDFGESENRFTTALKNHFKDKKYKNRNTWLFKKFRGPLIHQYRPGDEVYLTSLCKNRVPITEHFGKKDGKTILVLEKFFIDFKQAVASFKTLAARNNSLNKEKLAQDYSQIITYPNPNFRAQFFNNPVQDYSVSGTTSYHKMDNTSKASKK